MSFTWMARRVLVGGMGAAMMGCASAGGGWTATDAEPPVGASSDVITSAELSRLDPGLTLTEVIEHSRPWFLHSRGSNSSVSLDGSPPTEATLLRTIPTSQVKEVRLVRGGATAILPDGTAAMGDVILVVTRMK